MATTASRPYHHLNGNAGNMYMNSNASSSSSATSARYRAPSALSTTAVADEDTDSSRASIHSIAGNSVDTLLDPQSSMNGIERPGMQHSFTAPAAFEDDSMELPPEEHVTALHDFASSNSTCLSFRAGQVIKVFNRDQSGWWDGELDGQRGWFPSNYVDQEGLTSSAGSPERISMGLASSDGSDHLDEPTPTYPQHRRNASSSGRNGVARRADRVYAPQASRSPTPTATSFGFHASAGIMDPILHAVALLQNAVRANRVAHFQPSTACVISSVRSVLSATDCLTRESQVLKTHGVLARERKQILSELSRLVTQARKASAPMADETRRASEMQTMMKVANLVLNNVRRFLEVAVECGVELPDRRSSIYDDLYGEDVGSAGLPDRHEQDKTPTPDSPRSTAFTSSHFSPRGAKSYGDLRRTGNGNARMARGGHEYEPSGLTQAERIKERVMRRTQSDSSDSPDSASGSASSESLVEPVTPGPVSRTPQEVLQRLSAANDQLLSIIAAFIGHVHTHTRESHASSYAHLIDMTREAVDGVRDLLLVVEAVNNSPTLQSERPKEVAILWQTRESLYEATTALVTAARVVTSAPNVGSPTHVASAEDDEKSRLLQAATGVLRTGGECVGAVRLCIGDPALSSLVITLSEPTKSRSFAEAPHDSETAMLEEEEVESAPNGVRRGKHTLSFLGRKATSLSCLREKYERDGYVNEFDDINENEWDEDGEGSNAFYEADEERRGDDSPRKTSLSDRRGVKTPKPLQERSQGRQTQSSRRPPAVPDANDDTSDSPSEAMSKDNSRASGSTIHSARSDLTADTSTRPSLEEGVPDPYPIADSGVPHTAPLYGKFLHDNPRMRGKDMHPIDTSVANRPNAQGVDRMVQEARSQGTPHDQRSLPSLPATPVESRYLAPDYDPTDVSYNSEGQVTGATLQALIEKMTPHDTTIDATFANAFFLTFRLFTTPTELFDALVVRYNLQPPKGVELTEEEYAKWQEGKVTPVRLRIFNFLKSWLEVHWHPATDHVILDRLVEFTRTTMTHSLSRAGQRLADLAQKRIISGPQKTNMMVGSQRGLQRAISTERMKNGVPMAMTDSSSLYPVNGVAKGGPMAPTPIISKGLLSNLRVMNHTTVNVLDFDPLELARQLTVMESKLYCAIQPEELLGQEFSKKAGVSNAVHVKGMSSLSTHITGWIAECILGESDARKRTQLVKFFIKLGDRCFGLNNFNTLMAIQCALNSSTIARLKKTWDGLPAKYRGMMEQQRRAIEHTRNFAGYRARLRGTIQPALPFLGLFLTDLTFCHEGNAATRPSPSDPQKRLLNFDKYIKMSRIIGDLQRFQVPYNLMEVPEIQNFLRAVLADVQGGGGGMTTDDLYRRSLLLEPRSGDVGTTNGSGPTGTVASRSGGDGKLGLDIFNWKG